MSPAVLRALLLFAAAGVAEIGGGWLVWQWLRAGWPWPAGLLGALVLVGYGIIPTLQSEPAFGRVYAAYGGVFVVLSLLWGRLFDGFRADRWDLLGALLCLTGVLVIMFGPRSAPAG
ncbi:MAG TPA: YnfA family protein [Chloroflexota bacterium]|nr:YnfA family protein [Chloroflexota bacterium]